MRATLSALGKRGLVACAAVSLSALAAVAPNRAAAEIGLSHGKPGRAYLSVEGGYRHGEDAKSIAPQAGGSSAIPDGVSVSERAIASPNGVEATSSVSTGSNSAGADASAKSGHTETTNFIQQSSGNQSISTNASTRTDTTSTSAAAQNTAAITANEGPDGGTTLSTTTASTPFSAVGHVTSSTSGAGTASGTAPTFATLTTAAGQTTNSTATTNTLAQTQTASAATRNSGVGPASASASASASLVDGTAALSAAATAQGAGVAVATTAAAVTGAPPAQAFAAFNASTSTPTVATANVDPTTAIDSLSAEDGMTGGLSVGYVLPERLFGIVDRIEAFTAFSRNDDEQATAGYNFAKTSVDGRAALLLFDSNGLAGTNSYSEHQREFGLRFKSDNFTDTAFPLIVSFEPFYRTYKQQIDATVTSDYAFHSEADARLYGAEAALETEISLLRQMLSFVGRISAGLYGIDVDGTFSERIGTYTVGRGTGSNDTGYRLGAEAGLRLQVNPTSFVTLTGAIDYLSEAPSVATDNAKGGIGSLVMDDSTDYQVKLGFTFVSGAD